MAIITKLKAYEVLDSRGMPALEAKMELLDGKSVIASVPSGASVGSLEALELRDGGNRYMGRGVLKAASNVNNIIAPAIIGKNVFNFKDIDDVILSLDSTINKEKLGANATLVTSILACKASALVRNCPLYSIFTEADDLIKASNYSFPVPLFNILNGGAHANNNIDIQEFMIVPAGIDNISEAIRSGAEIYAALKNILKEKGLSTAVGDEGGFAPNLSGNKEALDLIMLAVKKAGYKIGEEIYLALDIAATEFYKDGKYNLSSENKVLTSEEFVDVIEELVTNYPIISVEDGMAEDDFDGWKLLTKRLGNKIQLVGDDLFVTNTQILAKGIKQGLSNSILIKANQIGTVSEALAAIKLASLHGYSSIISHRSGETEDTTIVDIAVGTKSGQIKTGAPARGERTAKYNQLLRIYQDFPKMKYAGKSAFQYFKQEILV